MEFDVHGNFAYATVTSAPSPGTSGTTLVVSTATFAQFPSPGTSTAYNVVAWPAGTIPLASNAEVMRLVTKGTNGTVEVTRAQESSTNMPVAVGYQFAMNITSKNITDVETATGGLTTKGDLHTYSTLDTRLGVGANNAILQAASGETTGLKWSDDIIVGTAQVDVAFAGTAFKDEDDMASNSAVSVASQQSIKAYVDNTTAAGKQELFSNALINGGFDVWQRNTTFTYNDDTFGPDRWNLLTETNGAWTCARDTDIPGTAGFKYSAKFTNVTLNNQCALVQILENLNALKLDDQAVSLSFYAKTSGTEIGNLRATVLSWNSTADAVTSDVIGTWASDGTDPTWAANWTAEVAGSNKALTASWQRFTVENIAIDTASMANIAVVVWVDDGTIAANDDFWITGIMLNVGATANAWRPRQLTDEIELCERYYQKSYSLDTVPATNTSVGSHFHMGVSDGSGNGIAHIDFRVRMRGTPTVTWYQEGGSAGWNYARSGASGTAAMTTNRAGETKAGGFMATGANWTACQINGHWVAEIEM